MAIEPGWAVVLGASSGFGAAACRAFAAAGLDVAGVHLDRKATQPLAAGVKADVEAAGRQALFFNVNAVDPDARAEVIEAIGKASEGGPKVRVLLHSLAFGTLRPLVSEDAKGAVSAAQMAMTLNVMATSLVDWSQGLLGAGLLERRARVFAMTSSGGRRVWGSYGPVSAAKAALESLIRQLALELAPYETTANAICAGVTETPALQKIPGSDRMAEMARARNPRGRLTRPEDAADAMVVLADEKSGWISGNVINVDGGEEIVA